MYIKISKNGITWKQDTSWSHIHTKMDFPLLLCSRVYTQTQIVVFSQGKPYHTSSEILPKSTTLSLDCWTQNRLNGPLWPPGSSIRSPRPVFLLKRKTPTNRVLHHSPKYTHLLKHTPKKRLGKNQICSPNSTEEQNRQYTHTHALTHARTWEREREKNTTTARVSTFASENPNRRDSRSKLDWRCANWVASPHGRGICLGEVCGLVVSLFVSRGAGHSFSRRVW